MSSGKKAIFTLDGNWQSHHFAPGVTVADYITALSKTPLLTSANEIAHEECGDCGRPPVM